MKDSRAIKLKIFSEKSQRILTLSMLLTHSACLYGKHSTCCVNSDKDWIKNAPAVYDVIISEAQIGSVFVDEADICVCIDKIGYDYFCANYKYKTSGVIFYDPGVFTLDGSLKGCKVPASTIAQKQCADKTLWDFVLLGCVIRLGRLVSLDCISSAIRSSFEESQIQRYLKAIDAGSKLSKKINFQVND